MAGLVGVGIDGLGKRGRWTGGGGMMRDLGFGIWDVLFDVDERLGR